MRRLQYEKDFGNDEWRKCWMEQRQFERQPCYKQNYQDWERSWVEPDYDYYCTYLPILTGFKAWKEQENANEMFPQTDDTFYCTKCKAKTNCYMDKPGKCRRCRRFKHSSR